MPRRRQTIFAKGPQFTVATMGDSLTDAFQIGTRMDQQYPARLESKLNALGCAVRARNFGRSGDTTGHMLNRFGEMTLYDIPALAVIYGGVNDGANTLSITLTSTGTAATATTAFANGHALQPGMTVTIAGATPAGYNGVVVVTSTPTPNTFTYTVSAGLGAATGTITAAWTLAVANTANNLHGMALSLQNGAKGIVYDHAYLPAGKLPGERWIVVSDASTTGGLNPTGAAIATVTGTASGVQVWICRNFLTGEAGWSRVATLATPVVSKVIICSPHFLNYSTGGDTVGVSGSHSGQNASYLAIHNALVTMTTANSIPLCDLYSYYQDQLINGYDTAHSYAWHYADLDQHHNAWGEDLKANAVLATIQAQSEWIRALS